MLYSHYYHGKYGNTTEQFHQDVVKEINSLKNCTEKYSYRACLYGQNMTQNPHVRHQKATDSRLNLTQDRELDIIFNVCYCFYLRKYKPCWI